ncbi:GNAT family N-acetyltransferase [Actinoplanes sp. NPDC049265]|uniref:GNAT family N-acetyltransferase n=1 Tax=Actinoplanes sp. NPDC049265 TaxID=3363902 RepID=UPI003716022B
MRIRRAGAADVEALRSLIATMGYRVGPTELEARLRSLPENHAVFVAESGSGVAGWVHVLIGHSLIDGPRAELGGLSVADEAQGLGAGSALLSAAEEWAAERGVRTIHLRSGTERTGAHAFYRSRGYQVVKSQLALRKTTG